MPNEYEIMIKKKKNSTHGNNAVCLRPEKYVRACVTRTVNARAYTLRHRAMRLCACVSVIVPARGDCGGGRVERTAAANIDNGTDYGLRVTSRLRLTTSDDYNNSI